MAGLRITVQSFDPFRREIRDTKLWLLTEEKAELGSRSQSWKALPKAGSMYLSEYMQAGHAGPGVVGSTREALRSCTQLIFTAVDF